MIGIIGAMSVEVEALKSALNDKQTTVVGSTEYVSGRLFGTDVVVAQCGIGMVQAAICAQAMILLYHPDVLLNTGVAGTLTDKLSIGDVAISSDVVQHDMNTSVLGDPRGLISGPNLVHFPADEKLIALAKACLEAEGLHYEVGTVASGDQFICDQAVKDDLAETFRGIACEMEGGAIGITATVNHVPFVVLRSISDGANDDSHMDFPTFVAMAAERSIRVTKAFVKALAENA